MATSNSSLSFILRAGISLLEKLYNVDYNSLVSFSTLFSLLLADIFAHPFSNIFGRLFVFLNGLATSYPSIRSLSQRKLQWETVFGIEYRPGAENLGLLSGVLLRHSWNRAVAGLTCMAVSLGNLENHAVAVILLGLQKMGSLGVMSMYLSTGAELSELSKRRLRYDVRTAALCLWYGIILLLRRRRRDSPLAMYRRLERRLENRLDNVVFQLQQERANNQN